MTSVQASCMGISAVTWRCPRCNVDVGGSLGELRHHWKRAHGSSTTNESTGNNGLG
ncbi:MAG: hypothetical protein M3270_02585 [Thermoproteota archaeon]|nr:hypothetical protein [Thermoproteota archaeon]